MPVPFADEFNLASVAKQAKLKFDAFDGSEALKLVKFACVAVPFGITPTILAVFTVLV